MGGGPRGAKAQSGWKPGPRKPGGAKRPGGWKPGGDGPRGAKASSGGKPGARKPGGAKRPGDGSAGGRKPGGKPPSWKSPSWKSPGRKRDIPQGAARTGRDAPERRTERAPAPREERFPPIPPPPRGKSSRPGPRDEKPKRPREELPRDLIRRKPWLQMPPRRETPGREARAPAAGLETSDIRRGVREAIADAHATGPTVRRERVARAEAVGSELLKRVAAPLFRTVASVLTAEGYRFTVSTPPDAVRLSSEASGDDYVEFALDTKRDPPALLVRSARVRRDEGVIDERIVAEHPAIGTLTDAHLLTVLLTALRFVLHR